MWSHVRTMFRVLERQGDHAALARCAEKLVALPQLGETSVLAWGGQQLAVCCKLALADATLDPAARDRAVTAFQERSFALMDRALDRGWRPDFGKPAFDGVRGHPEFARLATKAAAAAKPAAAEAAADK
jgi:hypothetical protein